MNQQVTEPTYADLIASPAPSLPAVVEGQHQSWVPALLKQAIAEKSPLEVIGKLMDYQDRWDATQARKAFNIAFAKAKAKFPIVRKNRRVGFESKRTGDRTDYAYETLAEIDRTVGQILANEGLFYRWRVTNTEKSVTVTCVLSHELGHYEENTSTGPLDLSGNKNPLQAIGSAQTYFERYTLKAALGIASEEDDDARATSNREDRPKPPSSKPAADGETLYTIPHRVTGMTPLKWADQYKAGIRTAKSRKELAKWAFDNADALAALGKLGESDDPAMKSVAYLVDEVDAFYAECLDLLDGKEPKPTPAAATPPHDPETGEIFPEPGKRPRPPSPGNNDTVQQIMALKEPSDVFEWMRDHPTMTKAEVAAMGQRKKELGVQ
jgi:ERF superfamily